MDVRIMRVWRQPVKCCEGACKPWLLVWRQRQSLGVEESDRLFPVYTRGILGVYLHGS
jgi:hypothetical protein